MTNTERLSTALADRYKIESPLGEGGMATVYLARDLKHDRNVAVKVLRPELAAILGGERFLNEIKVTANLQHPNILPLYDSGEADSFLYYVMPYLEGESLRDKLDREKQLGVEETVTLAKEVAAALQFAHERGVVHRDIKPENIMLQAGQAVVADFGIALAVSQAGGSRLTETGLSLGTPHYMSPEQATGDREVDARSDVYSLGSMVYEMLVGEPPHVGNSVQAIIAKILSDDPPSITRTRQLVPANIDAAVFKALAKSPADRFSTARAFAEALTDLSFTLTAGAVTPVALAKHGSRWLTAGLAMLALALAVALGINVATRPDTPITVYRLGFSDDQAPMPVASGQRLTISPDGSKIVYVGVSGDGGRQLWLRDRDQLDARPLAGTDESNNPFFSPDGTKLGFFTILGISVTSLLGGRPVVVLDTGVGVGGAAWGNDGYIYYDADLGGLRRVPDTGGPVETVVPLDAERNETGFAWPELVPGSNQIIFRTRRLTDLPGDFSIDVADIETGERTELTTGLVARFFAPDQLLIATFPGGLSSVRFEPGEAVLGDRRVNIAADLAVGSFGSADLAVSNSGTLVYAAGTGDGFSRWVTVDRTGTETATPLDVTLSRVTHPALSPNGARLAFIRSDEGGRTDIWIADLTTGEMSRFTFGGLSNWGPNWSADGHSVTFISNRDGRGAFYSKPVDGSGAASLLVEVEGRAVSEGFLSPSGEWAIVRTSTSDDGDGDILGVRVGSGEDLVPLVATPAQEINPSLSPDGKWLAYSSNENGVGLVYVRPFPNVEDGRWQISNQQSIEPIWSRSGQEIFYRATGNLMSAHVRTTGSFAVESREPLFRSSSYPFGFLFQSYAVLPEDRGFFLQSTQASLTSNRMVVVNNLQGVLDRESGN